MIELQQHHVMNKNFSLNLTHNKILIITLYRMKTRKRISKQRVGKEKILIHSHMYNFSFSQK